MISEEEEEATTMEDEVSYQSQPLLRPVASPKDRLNANYLVFYILGMGTLLPWNFFISVSSFWDYKFRDVNATTHTRDDEKTELQEEFTSYLAIASNVPNAIFVILNAVFGQKIDLKYRMFFSLTTVIILFCVVLAFSKANSDSWQHEFLVFMLILVVIVNCCTAIFQGALFGVAGKFPPTYIGSVMAGQAMGGIFPALVDICFTAVRVEPKDMGFACFFIATLVLLASLISFSWMRRTQFFKHYANQEVLTTTEPPVSSAETGNPILEIVKENWQYCVSVWLVFTTTLAVFPAVTVLVQSENESSHTTWTELYFTPVTCFLLFNCGDYAGRIISSWIQWPGRRLNARYLTLLLSLGRVIFVPLIFFCNAAPAKRSLPVYFHTDFSYIFIMILFSVSNGYLGNLCMLHGPKLFENGSDQELSAMVLVACLVLGTSTGSFLSYPLVGLL